MQLSKDYFKGEVIDLLLKELNIKQKETI